MHAKIYTFNIFFIFAYIATKFCLQDTRLIPNVGMVRFLDKALKHKYTRFNEQKRKKTTFIDKKFLRIFTFMSFFNCRLESFVFRSVSTVNPSHRCILAYLNCMSVCNPNQSQSQLVLTTVSVFVLVSARQGLSRFV